MTGPSQASDLVELRSPCAPRLDGFGSADCLTFKGPLGTGYLVTVPEFPRMTLKSLARSQVL